MSFDREDGGPKSLSSALSLGKSNSGLSFPVPGMWWAPLVAFRQEGDLSESDGNILLPSPGHRSTKGGTESLTSADLKEGSLAAQVGLWKMSSGT